MQELKLNQSERYYIKETVHVHRKLTKSQTISNPKTKETKTKQASNSIPPNHTFSPIQLREKCNSILQVKLQSMHSDITIIQVSHCNEYSKKKKNQG